VPEVALCPVELSNVAVEMARRMHQNMQLETHKLKKNSSGPVILYNYYDTRYVHKRHFYV